MGMVELFVPIAVMMALTVMLGLITRVVADGMLNRTIREAIRSDPGSVPILVQKLDSRQPWADSLLGWIFLAFALALLILGLMEPDDGDRTQLLRAVIVPTIVGIAILVYTRSKAKTVTGL
jgi:quinol-cytochrome oxidoreductase complex cytochrome b subunit